MTDKILIVDFGSQVTQLIARRVREAGIYCEVHPYNHVNKVFVEKFDPKGLILSGGPSSVTLKGSPRLDEALFEMGLPILGICYGQQTLCLQLGGQVGGSEHQEFGRAQIDIIQDSPLFKGAWNVGSREVVWMSHGDHVTSIPQGFKTIAQTKGAPFAVIANEERKFYGVQFHPEVVHTPHGAQLLVNFAKNVCGCQGDWTMAHFRTQALKKIKTQVGDKKVICGLSGGVDSSVAAVLVHEAIGEQLTCIFIDHGLMRENEAQEVIKLFETSYHIPLIHRNASDIFLKALEGVTDPEKKRKIIGNLFIEVFEQEAEKLGGADFLVQGTLYPDVIESVSVTGGPSVTIKSHHNVGGLPEKMNLKLVEPLRDLFKDEVRLLGKELDLPDSLVSRHPFPGPGLAVRIPGAITKQKADILRKADAIYLDEIRKAGLYHEIWQAFAVLLPVKTVGVMGDGRTYDYVCALRAVTSTDGMTAEAYGFSHEFLTGTATRIINEVRGINRIVYDVTSKPPGTIEWE